MMCVCLPKRSIKLIYTRTVENIEKLSCAIVISWKFSFGVRYVGIVYVPNRILEKKRRLRFNFSSAIYKKKKRVYHFVR